MKLMAILALSLFTIINFPATNKAEPGNVEFSIKKAGKTVNGQFKN